LLLQSFATLLRQSNKDKTGLPDWVNKIKEIINDEYSNRVTLLQLSRETGIHPVHLSKEFPKYFNAGFGEYIRQIKIEKANQLLTQKELTLSQITYQCGFADQSHFIRCFKAMHGITPLKYRNRILKR
jgi:AraC family transcriptional regulator